MWCVVLECDCEITELNRHVVFIAAAADWFMPSLNHCHLCEYRCRSRMSESGTLTVHQSLATGYLGAKLELVVKLSVFIIIKLIILPAFTQKKLHKHKICE